MGQIWSRQRLLRSPSFTKVKDFSIWSEDLDKRLLTGEQGEEFQGRKGEHTEVQVRLRNTVLQQDNAKCSFHLTLPIVEHFIRNCVL